MNEKMEQGNDDDRVDDGVDEQRLCRESVCRVVVGLRVIASCE